MVDLIPSFETADIVGTTSVFTGSASSFAQPVPSTPGASIEELSVRCRVDQDPDLRLEVSIDGINWLRLCVGETWNEEPRGGAIKQIQVRSTSATSVLYEIILNRGQS